ncbi:MAG: hypothetical protein CL610_22255 [Anaerolineaceae bacterium]|nr:hypothetical protein [Anaerolineaceae bacterium]
MYDLNRAPLAGKYQIEEFHRQADHHRLVKIARAARKANRKAPQFNVSLGRSLIALGWRLAGSKNGTLVVDEPAAGHELWVVDVPC